MLLITRAPASEEDRLSGAGFTSPRHAGAALLQPNCPPNKPLKYGARACSIAHYADAACATRSTFCMQLGATNLDFILLVKRSTKILAFVLHSLYYEIKCLNFTVIVDSLYTSHVVSFH